MGFVIYRKYRERGYWKSIFYRRYVVSRPAADDLAWNLRNRRFVQSVFYGDRARFAKDRVSPVKVTKLRGRIARARSIRQHLIIEHFQTVIISAGRRCYRILFQVFELTAHTRCMIQIRETSAFHLNLHRNRCMVQLRDYQSRIKSKSNQSSFFFFF